MKIPIIFKDLKVLQFDIETLPISADIWQLGQQYINHKQLQPNRNMYDVITIQYKWIDEDKVHNLSWIGKDENSSQIIEKFDEQVKKADLIIGKNSDRFDIPHINTYRMLHNLPPIPMWDLPRTKRDVEKMLRKHFYFPSYSLDAVCKILFDSGKDKMEFQDWLDIRNYKETLNLKVTNQKDLDLVCKFFYAATYKQVIKKGKEALKKMRHYGDKDVLDTEKLLFRIAPYCKPIMNKARFYGHEDGNYLRCKECGTKDILKNGVDKRVSVPKQMFKCNNEQCPRFKRHCGSASILKHGKYGKVE